MHGSSALAFFRSGSVAGRGGACACVCVRRGWLSILAYSPLSSVDHLLILHDQHHLDLPHTLRLCSSTSATNMTEVQATPLNQYVGFDSITRQIETKLLKRGFQFNVSVGLCHPRRQGRWQASRSSLIGRLYSCSLSCRFRCSGVAVTVSLPAQLLNLVHPLSGFCSHFTGHGRWADWSGKVNSHQHTLR